MCLQDVLYQAILLTGKRPGLSARVIKSAGKSNWMPLRGQNLGNIALSVTRCRIGSARERHSNLISKPHSVSGRHDNAGLDSLPSNRALDFFNRNSVVPNFLFEKGKVSASRNKPVQPRGGSRVDKAVEFGIDLRESIHQIAMPLQTVLLVIVFCVVESSERKQRRLDFFAILF